MLMLLRLFSYYIMLVIIYFYRPHAILFLTFMAVFPLIIFILYKSSAWDNNKRIDNKIEQEKYLKSKYQSIQDRNKSEEKI